ncbi:response regulator [Oscillatoriales cyanobacterium LEGE 11467]|uniref:Response regulator n=1 Tax=Zarconia navalis LEGE 11467 TaxID=1828826 RepID=A0A928VWF2_9CYAN|nr:adenylate/guanylate cyclase domain-containing protein [Zarconia navalis]MBE9039496.1 response regulator [Zarconia navalis LEGE 11467]
MSEKQAKILLVDDKPNNLHYLSEILLDRGYQVQRAISGQLAINAALDSPPDLILLDVLMPKLDGYEVCEKLKRSKLTRDIPIIFVSVLEQAFDKVKAFKAGGVDYITKPFQLEEVIARIENQLTIFNLQKKLKEKHKELTQYTLRLQAEIAERKRTQEALLLAEKRYNNLVDNSIEGIFQANPSGRLLSANIVLARLFGYDSLEDLVEKVPNVSGLYVQPDRFSDLMSQLEYQDTLCNFESLVYKKNGQTIWISENARAVRDTTGTLLYYEGTVIDITVQKISQEALKFHKDRNEQLLQSILPARIARRLQQGEARIAESFDDVSILFADITGFTEFAACKTPKEQLAILDRIFSRFDELAQHYGLERIKTIGDAYMIAGGLPMPHSELTDTIVEHLPIERVARMALDMQIAMTELGTSVGRVFPLRIGIHIGSVVAGAIASTIGHSKFIYDLWGETVNLASLMESTGLPGQIQVTPEVYDRLHEGFAFEKREPHSIDRQREMTTYWLRGRQPQSQI